MADAPNDDALRRVLQQLIFGFFPSAVLSVAARLRIPDLVAAGPKSSDELAVETATHPPSLYRLLRALAYLGILAETEPGRFGLTDLGAFLRSDVPDSMWATTQLFCGEGVWRSWVTSWRACRPGSQASSAASDWTPLPNSPRTWRRRRTSTRRCRRARAGRRPGSSSRTTSSNSARWSTWAEATGPCSPRSSPPRRACKASCSTPPPARLRRRVGSAPRASTTAVRS